MERQLLARYAQGDFCYCGCPHTVGSCLAKHGACRHAARQVRLAAGVAGAPGATLEAIRGFVAHYYASFDRRARIDLAAFGPPLGEQSAPVTLVEFSDFTCPFCQPSARRWRPSWRPPRAGEALLQALPHRVPPGRARRRHAGEWARDQGIFWKFHDAMFDTPGHDLDSLAGAAEELGMDGSDLRDAVTSRRFEPQVRASQTRPAGGRDRHPHPLHERAAPRLPDYSAAWLEFALQDEEEWIRNKGKWDRD